jgi:hypothetical protein
MLALSVAASTHWFFALVGAGKYRDYMFGSSTKTTLIYLLCVFGFVVVDCAIVWGFMAMQGSGYGPMPPWRFCWVSTQASFWLLGKTAPMQQTGF